MFGLVGHTTRTDLSPAPVSTDEHAEAQQPMISRPNLIVPNSGPARQKRPKANATFLIRDPNDSAIKAIF